ncbi:DUF4129 domain-containing protein [Actinotalea caeni]|uniref:DUF4129 domain-containing protein n=1 Tax=Actinotalea caeni TaxID=1348467 RepID=UPI0012E1AF77|nr:DUF4129 domain-containing protein [Actinotalea caeni]
MVAGPAWREPPLTPSADEARAWIEAELAKAIYNRQPSLWDRLREWLGELWARLFGSSADLGPVLMPVVVLLVVALAVGVALLLGGPVRRRRLRGRDSVEVLDDDVRTAAAIRAAADAAAARGDFRTAVLDRFRAIVRSLDERAVLEDRRGRTAHEAALAAGARLQPCAAELLRASELFDAVCYGDVTASAEDDAWLREVDAAVARTRPSRTGDLTEPDLVAPR